MALRKRVAAPSLDSAEVAALIGKLWRGLDHPDEPPLTRDDYKILIEVLRGERKLQARSGPKPDFDLPLRDKAIASLVALFKADGRQTEAAVAEVSRRCGVSRSKVFAAWRQHPQPSMELLHPNLLQALIAQFEEVSSR